MTKCADTAFGRECFFEVGHVHERTQTLNPFSTDQYRQPILISPAADEVRGCQESKTDNTLVEKQIFFSKTIRDLPCPLTLQLYVQACNETTAYCQQLFSGQNEKRCTTYIYGQCWQENDQNPQSVTAAGEAQWA